MNTLAWLIFVAGMLHFGILIASVLVPRVLDWKQSLENLDRLLRQVIWVHGAFIALVIASFGVLSMGLAADLADGSRTARAVCALIATFWACRLAVQCLVFDAQPHLRGHAILRLGYHALTVVFVYHVAVFGYAAAAGG
jgi:hypothetical protein